MIKKVKSVLEKQTAAGKTFFQVTFEDDVVASGFDELFRDSVGKEFDVEIKQNGQYANVNIIKPKFGGKPFIPKNPKETALDLAVRFSTPRLELKSGDVLKVAELFLGWMKE